MIALPPPAPENPPDDQGGMGGLFTQQAPGRTGEWHLRSDARLAAKILSLGVVSEDQMQNLLKAGTGLAAQAANSGNARDYAAVMKIFVAAAKLELDTAKHIDPTPTTVNHRHAHAIIEPEQRRTSVTSEIVAELERRGITDATPRENGSGSGAGTNGHTNGATGLSGPTDN